MIVMIVYGVRKFEEGFQKEEILYPSARNEGGAKRCLRV